MLPISGQRGFSLIELMIVVAILGILAVIAIPSYQTYTERARFAEVIMATEIYKTSVSIAIQQGTPLEELINGSHGIPLAPKTTRNVESVNVNAGTITATATALAGKHTYILKPNSDGSSWTVSGSCIKSGLCNA